MSHVVKVKTTIKSLSALRKAAERCGLEFMEGQQTYRWFGRFVGDSPMPDGFYWVSNKGQKHGTGTQKLGTCNHALRVKGLSEAYEVGVYAKSSGEYGIVWDWWANGHGLQPRIGNGQSDADKLLGEYAFAVAEEVAAQQGWTCHRTENGMEISIWDPVAGKMGVVTIKADGVDAAGFVGGACQDPVTRISEALGVIKDTTYKPEYYENPQHLYEGG